MRVVTGEAKGRRLKSPKTPGTRPIIDRVKTALEKEPAELGNITCSAVAQLLLMPPHVVCVVASRARDLKTFALSGEH